jgi:hypothetical protein
MKFNEIHGVKHAVLEGSFCLDFKSLRAENGAFLDSFSVTWRLWGALEAESRSRTARINSRPPILINFRFIFGHTSGSTIYVFWSCFSLCVFRLVFGSFEVGFGLVFASIFEYSWHHHHPYHHPSIHPVIDSSIHPFVFKNARSSGQILRPTSKPTRRPCPLARHHPLAALLSLRIWTPPLAALRSLSSSRS